MSHEFKIILLGEPGVGKTSLIHTYTTGQFNPNRKKTRVVNLMTKEFILEGKRVKLCIWDTSSLEFFKNVVPNYYDGFLLVYDVTDITTFRALSDWLKLLRGKNDEAAALVVGNKTDLLEGAGVSNYVANEFAGHEHLEYMESSAKNGKNVAEIFEHLTQKILEVKNLVSNEDVNCGATMSSNFSCKESSFYDNGPEISLTEDRNGTSCLTARSEQCAEHENDSEKLQESSLKVRKLPLEPEVQISLNNRNDHETILQQISPNKENGQLNIPESDQVIGDNETNNHKRTLKNCHQTSLCKENGHSSISESSDLIRADVDDDMDEIESSFVFVSFLPPIVPLPEDIPLLRVGRRRTSADSVLSLMTETEINNVKLRAKMQIPEASR